ncbi:unnamed protein product [Zymoseptoria tritici ST99CH_3D1]|nr:unnamed protein product [Zymoseptoria tritici ST99CH_3D1]
MQRGEEGFFVWDCEPGDEFKTYSKVNKLLRMCKLTPTNFEKYIKGKLDKDYTQDVPKEFDNYKHLFDRRAAESLPNLLLPYRANSNLPIDFELGSKIPFKKPYLIGEKELAIVRKHIDNLIKKGVIRESKSPCSLPVLLIKKGDGRIRVCINYRAVNAITVKNRYPLPHIRETLLRIGRAKIFTVLDIVAAFNRLRIREGDE